MKKKIRGYAWKYKDNINTDIISPPKYMELNISEASKYAMSPIDVNFANNVKNGDIFVCENNLGSGSSRETAPLMLKELGIFVIIAKSYARIFYRNAINIGLIALECDDTDRINKGDILEIYIKKGEIKNITKNETYKFNKLPDHILELVKSGGLMEYIVKKRTE